MRRETVMSEQNNVQVVQDMYAAFGRGDLQEALSTLVDDVTWQVPGPTDMPWAGLRRGRQQVAEWFAVIRVVSRLLRWYTLRPVANNVR